MSMKLDILSDMRVPFSVAAFCRGRKHLPESAALLRTLKSLAHAEKALDEAQDAVTAAEAEIKNAVDKVTARMTAEGAHEL